MTSKIEYLIKPNGNTLWQVTFIENGIEFTDLIDCKPELEPTEYQLEVIEMQAKYLFEHGAEKYHELYCKLESRAPGTQIQKSDIAT